MNYKTLKELVKHHSKAYYDKYAPEISDEYFDKLYDDLEAVEKAQGWYDHDSPCVKVGGKAGKVNHPYKLYSLRKVYDPEEVDDSYNVETPKIDGANLDLIYKRGKLTLALTRGNGEMGDNVIHLVTGISNIPQTISTIYDEVVINGECVTNNSVENFRNYVAGALGLKSLAEFTERNIVFIAHDWLGVPLNYKKRMSIAEDLGFTTVLSEAASKYPKDGVVFRHDNYEKSAKLGYTSKYPRFAVALKPRGEDTAETTLQDVLWVVGRTGSVNPTGVIDSVVLEDATITRVTLHNIGIIEQHNLGLGDRILVERAGGVIPKFIRVIEHAKHNAKISIKDAETAVNLSLIRKGPKLYVADKNDVNTSKILEHFIKILEIKGLGPASVKKMGLDHPAQLFKSQNWDSLGAVGTKIEDEIERAKTKPYDQVLASLGISGVGRSMAKLIITKIPKFLNLRDIEYTTIRGVGPATVESILTWLDENEDWVTQLPLSLEQDVTVDRVLARDMKKVCLTGKLDMSRKDLADILETKGYKVTSTVTKDCYALITAGDTTSSKYLKAKQSDINIVDYWANQKDVMSGNF